MKSHEAYQFIIKESKNKQPANWIQFDEECFKQMPSSSGIYLMRLSKSIERLESSSDLYYIGRSKNLRQRLRQHWRGDNYKYASQIIKKLYKTGKIEIMWIEVALQVSEEVEVKCLEDFFKKHLELPPGNSNIRNWEKYR